MEQSVGSEHRKSPSGLLAIPGQLASQLRRSVSTRSRSGRSTSPSELLTSLRRSASTQSRFGRATSPEASAAQAETPTYVELKHGRYTPLVKPSKDIRLVLLEPAGSNDEPVKCELETIDILRAKYEALSYAWGDPTDKVPILLGGGLFYVTRNLEQALRSLRYFTSDLKQQRVLWIDALCIDQQNAEERAQQVRRMGSIYKSAERVLVWLGNYYEEEDDLVWFKKSAWGFKSQSKGTFHTTEEAFKLAESLCAESSVAASLKKKSRKNRRKPTMNLHVWGFLSVICQRSWFRRLWVIQEITLSKKAMICCGRVQLRWKILEGAADRIASYFETPTEWPFFGKLRFIDEMTSFAGNVSVVGLWDLDKTNILSILVHTQFSQASDPRDRLFAVKGLMLNDDSDIEIDYTKSADTIYKMWALKRIIRTRSLDCLTLCTDSVPESKKQNQHISWCPDLRNIALIDDTYFALANGFSQDHERPYMAAGKTKCGKVIIDESDFATFGQDKFDSESVLSLQGFHVATIEKRISVDEKFGIDYSDNNLHHAVAFLEEHISEFFKMSLRYSPQIYDGFLESLFKGWKWYAGSHPMPTLSARYRVWRNHIALPADFEPYIHADIRRRTYLGTLQTITRLMLRVSDIFITSNGMIGSMSKHCQAKAGDEIYVLFGGNAPFILDKHEVADDQVVHKLRCACFLNGYMYGEAVEAWRNGELRLKTVRIV